jgi:endonuclease YncB( thermonuclease family)
VVPVRDTFTGKVVGLSDGDTLSVLREGKAMKVLLYGIDTPESKRLALAPGNSPANWRLARSSPWS